MQMSKGLKMLLSMAGIPEAACENPATLMQHFGVNPQELLKFAGEFQQIGLKLENQLMEINARLARLEEFHGIGPGRDGDKPAGAGSDGNAEPAGTVAKRTLDS
jgi:hypothetical protein